MTAQTEVAPWPRRWHRLIRRPRQLWARLVELGPRLLGVGFWAVGPLMCLWAIWIGTGQLVHNANSLVAGIPGTYTAVSHNCQDQLCLTSGTFVSDDRLVVEHNLIGDYRWPVGSESRAVYNPASGEILGVAPPWDSTPTIVGMIGAVTFLCLWGYLFGLAMSRDTATESTGGR